MKNDRTNFALFALLFAAVIVLGVSYFLKNVDEQDIEERFIFPLSQDEAE